MSTLCFELTRRCNMNCDFCCRGDAQNKDITKEIIDKTLEEVKDCEVGAETILSFFMGVTDPESYNDITYEEAKEMFDQLVEIYKMRLLQDNPLLFFLNKLGVV